MTIDRSVWQWFGNAGHFICAYECRFHLTTQVGAWLVSTVGQYLPDSQVREIAARTRGVVLEGRGDAREYDYLRKLGYDDIGHGRKFETMVFRAGEPCSELECACGLPKIDGQELDVEGYNDAGAATRGHYAMCEKWAARGEAEAVPA